MPSWWGRSSSKDVNKKSKGTIIDTIRKFKCSDDKAKSHGPLRFNSDTILENNAHVRAEIRSQASSLQVSRCQSFNERPQAQPLPLPSTVDRTASQPSSRQTLQQKSSLRLHQPKSDCTTAQADASDMDGYFPTASVSSGTSIDSDDPSDSHPRSPYDSGKITNSPTSVMLKDQSSGMTRNNLKTTMNPSASVNNKGHMVSPKHGTGPYPPNIHIPQRSGFGISSAPDSSMSSPSRSPRRIVHPEHITNSTLWAAKPYPDISLLGSGQCSSPGSGQNSGHNSMGGELSSQFFWQHSRGSPEGSPIPSPRMTSPGPSSRVHSGAVTPLHPRVGGPAAETVISWPDDGKQQSYRLPLPPGAILNSSGLSPSNSGPVTLASVPRSPGRSENPPSPGSRWKKGKMIGRGTFGHVYVGFNRESGEMCAMKEVTLFLDDAKSKESAKQLTQEIALLSRLHHPNIVQYYGSETVDDKLYIYLEYVSGGSIHKLLQEYGQFGEMAIRSYTQQILSGLAYLHSKNTVHRDIKGANILVDPNGRVKLADFGMAKHIAGQSCPLSFKGSPYWMAPEVIKNSSGCNLAVDIWSLGCTVIEMAMAKPPWSQYEGVAAMFKIGNSKDLPPIPGHLSDEGRDFIRLCMQRNPVLRPSAAQLLEHPFVSVVPVEKSFLASDGIELPSGSSNRMKPLGAENLTNFSSTDIRLPVCQSKGKSHAVSSDTHMLKNISCPVSPTRSPLLQPRSPQHFSGRRSPSPIASPRTVSGSSTPLTGGLGAIPFNEHLKLPNMHEGFAGITRSLNNSLISGSSYYNSSRELLQPQIFQELVLSGNAILPKQQGRPTHLEVRDGQSLMVDHVSASSMR